MIPPAPLAIPTLALWSGQWATLFPMIGVLLIIMGLFMMIRKRKQRSAHEPTAREQLERSRQKQRMQGDLEHLMVELEQLTKRFSAQLDAKSLHLEKLIDQADRRIDELKRLQGESTDSGKIDRDYWSKHDPWASSSKPPSSTSSAPDRSERADAATTSSPTRTGEADLTHSVYELADQGFDAPDIARKLDEHVGKIELMLALRKA